MHQKWIEQEAGPHQNVPNDRFWEKTFRTIIYVLGEKTVLEERSLVGVHTKGNFSQLLTQKI